MNLNEFWVNAIWSIIPTIGVSAAFWLVIRSILRADRNERAAYAKVEKELRAERVRTATSADDPD